MYSQLNKLTVHKDVPDKPDQMFVPDCFTEVVNENGNMVLLFRIFLSTKRLLEFTKYVS